MAVGIAWSDNRLIAVDEDGAPVRPEWYSDEFHRLRERAGLRHIRSTAYATPASLDARPGPPGAHRGGWHGHDAAVSLWIYSEAKADELRAAGASLFG